MFRILRQISGQTHYMIDLPPEEGLLTFACKVPVSWQGWYISTFQFDSEGDQSLSIINDEPVWTPAPLCIEFFSPIEFPWTQNLFSLDDSVQNINRQQHRLIAANSILCSDFINPSTWESYFRSLNSRSFSKVLGHLPHALKVAGEAVFEV